MPSKTPSAANSEPRWSPSAMSSQYPSPDSSSIPPMGSREASLSSIGQYSSSSSSRPLPPLHDLLPEAAARPEARRSSMGSSLSKSSNPSSPSPLLDRLAVMEPGSSSAFSSSISRSLPTMYRDPCGRKSSQSSSPQSSSSQSSSASCRAAPCGSLGPCPAPGFGGPPAAPSRPREPAEARAAKPLRLERSRPCLLSAATASTSAPAARAPTGAAAAPTRLALLG
mmetsp:Transcript_82236/g.232898  ORF Transcript_82236/g.232898 Transcript_82236/m.232898 type:complete len:225 (+) Transcript_82236:2063-2737(+)